MQNAEVTVQCLCPILSTSEEIAAKSPQSFFSEHAVALNLKRYKQDLERRVVPQKSLPDPPVCEAKLPPKGSNEEDQDYETAGFS